MHSLSCYVPINVVVVGVQGLRNPKPFFFQFHTYEWVQVGMEQDLE